MMIVYCRHRSAIATGFALLPASFLLPEIANPANIASIKAASSSIISNHFPIPTWTLAGGVDFPILALNTAGLSADETFQATLLARREGITHIDFHPGDERDGVARYLSEFKEERGSMFLNTKVRKATPGTSPRDAAELCKKQISDDLKALNVDKVDMLMLRDSPDLEVIQAQWVEMEKALSEGKTRSIGVVNFCESALQSVLETAKVVPAVNYIMVHVGMGQNVHGLRFFGETNGIHTFAYGQTGEPEPSLEIINNPILKRIGEAHGGKSPEEVALWWVLQNGIAASIRPSSKFGICDGEECKLGIARQVHCFDWALSEKEMAELDVLTSPDDNPTFFSSAGCPGAYGL